MLACMCEHLAGTDSVNDGVRQERAALRLVLARLVALYIAADRLEEPSGDVSFDNACGPMEKAVAIVAAIEPLLRVWHHSLCEEK